MVRSMDVEAAKDGFEGPNSMFAYVRYIVIPSQLIDIPFQSLHLIREPWDTPRRAPADYGRFI
jgi:hypothetical protein